MKGPLLEICHAAVNNTVIQPKWQISHKAKGLIIINSFFGVGEVYWMTKKHKKSLMVKCEHLKLFPESPGFYQSKNVILKPFARLYHSITPG